MKKYRKYLIIIIILLIIIFLITKVFSFAKYVANYAFNYYLESKDFYFTSDKLDIDKIENVDKAYDGNPIKITLTNALNKQAITTYDINYKATCSVEEALKDQVGCRFVDNNESVFEGVLSSSKGCVNNTDDLKDVSNYTQSECEMNGYNYTTKVNSKDLYLEIFSLNEEEYSDVTVNVEVETTSPYKKTISGDFILHKKTNTLKTITLTYKEKTVNSNLVVTNNDSNDKCLTLKWDSTKLHIDKDNKEIISSFKDENNYLNGIKFKIKANSNINYTFYKTNFEEKLSETVFSIEEDGC